jgi:2-polyprenyl-3-methyl-5-hydroxy-6-metoxy-1,4-benzoquinol methylase
MESLTPCPFCESTKAQVSFRDHGYDKKDYAILKCKECGFQYINPLPNDEYLGELYSQYYGSALNQRQMATQLTYRLPVFEALCDLVEDKKIAGSRLLDIGCGNGDFIWLAQKRGWNVSGAELSESAVEYAVQMRDLDVVKAPSDKLPYDDNSFDVVTVLDVLEHLPNPHKVFASINRVLKPGGQVIVQVPNTPFQKIKAKVQRLKNGRQKTTMATPLHLNHFDGKSLAKFAEKSGLKVEKVFPGFADNAGPGLDVKKAYVVTSRLLWRVTGLQLGHSLCLIARK